MNNYSLKSLENYIANFDGEAIQLEEGILGLGTILLTNGSQKTDIIIREYFINTWTSGHDFRRYKNLPKKYKSMLEFTSKSTKVN